MTIQQQQLWKRKIRGWQLVSDRERAQEATKSAADIAEEISALFEAARHIPQTEFEKNELQAVRQTWIRIKRGSK